MNTKKKIITYNNLIQTYRSSIPVKQLTLLRSRTWFPFYYDSNKAEVTAYLIGKVMGDGHLDKKFTCKFVGYEDDLIKLLDLIKKTFKIKKHKFSFYHRKNIGKSTLLQVNDSLFGRFLLLNDAPQGNKTKISFYVPKWIILSNRTIKSFLQGIYEDELSTIKVKRKKYFREATLRMAKIESLQDELLTFLLQLIKMTEKLNVKCSNISKPYLENIKPIEDTYSQCFRILGNKKKYCKFPPKYRF